MSSAAREAFLEESLAALQRQAELAPEGRPHATARMGAATLLGDFFDRMGRAMFLGCDLPVHYPGEPVFAPDLMAVSDVEDPGQDDTRLAWVVAEEGRGVDLALEITYMGDRNEDLVENVARYARLAIPEYFVYDRRRQLLYGFRLAGPDARQYQRIEPRGARHRSQILGLDLGLAHGRLCFYYGDSEVPESRELVARLEGLMNERERRLDEAEARASAEAARADAEAKARAEAEVRIAALLAEIEALKR